jgi:hypothetical protein
VSINGIDLEAQKYFKYFSIGTNDNYVFDFEILLLEKILRKKLNFKK